MVQIQSKQARSMWATAALNSVPDIAIAWIASDVFDIGPIGFVAVFIGIQCLYLFLWLKTLLWSWLIYWISGRKKMTSHLENYLYQNRYPRPPEFVGGIEDYFSQVSNDTTIECSIRVKAAIELGTLVGIRTSGRYLQLMQLSMAYENALEQYARRFHPREEY